jgi:hypothetical protein
VAPGLTAACESSAARALIGAAASVEVAGFACHPEASAIYTLQPAPLNGQPHWASPGQEWHLFWATGALSISGEAAWIIDSDPGNIGWAFLPSPSDVPPSRSAVWVEFCDATWTRARLQLRCASLYVLHKIVTVSTRSLLKLLSADWNACAGPTLAKLGARPRLQR